MRKFIISAMVASIIFIFFLLLFLVVVPFYSNDYTRKYFDKIDMINRSHCPKIVFVGGSNVAFGFNCQQIADSIKGYSIINSGLNAGLGLKFIVDDIETRLGRGDVMVLSPEYDHFFGDRAYGGLALAHVAILDISKIGILNMSQMYAVANNISAHYKLRISYLLNNKYFASSRNIYTYDAFNQYGDVVKHWASKRLDYSQGVASVEKFNEEYFNYLIEQLVELSNRGVSVVLLPASISQSTYKIVAGQIAEVESRFLGRGFSFACPTGDMAFKDTLFFDTMYHLTAEGVTIKNNQVIRLLKTKIDNN